MHLGESWEHGAVVLSWNSARRGAADPRDGQNVILHEFAHQLDQEDGAADGTPELEQWAFYAPWARVLSEHYLVLRRRRSRGGKTLLDKYGATNEAEFFAVATRVFFERPLSSRPAIRSCTRSLRATSARTLPRPPCPSAVRPRIEMTMATVAPSSSCRLAGPAARTRLTALSMWRTILFNLPQGFWGEVRA